MERARATVEYLQVRLAELEDVSRIRSRILNELPSPQPLPLSSLLAALAARDADALRAFADSQPERDPNFVPRFGAQERDRAVQALHDYLTQNDLKKENPLFLTEVLRVVTYAARERNPASPNGPLAVSFVYLRLMGDASMAPRVRDGAAKCLNNTAFNESAVRTALTSDPAALTASLAALAARIADPRVSDQETARVIWSFRSLFSSDQNVNDKIVAHSIVESGLVSAIVSRIGRILHEDVLTAGGVGVREGSLSVSSSTEIKSRASVLDEGLRLMYVIAVNAHEEMSSFLRANEGVPPLEGEALLRSDLTPRAALGCGDRYTFVCVHLLRVEAELPADVATLDEIKLRVCSMLMLADKSPPGFVGFLRLQGAPLGLVRLLDRQLVRLRDRPDESLLPLLLALHTLITTDEEFREDLVSLLFRDFLPRIQAEEFASKEEFEVASKNRHFAGHVRKESTLGMLIKLLTCFEDHVKRFAGEILWTLCDSDGDKVTHVCGFGNAAHLLAMKGGMLGQIMAQQEEQQRQAAAAARNARGSG